MNSGRGSRRDDLDGLRAIAALLVVLFHAGFPVLPGGFIGVDVFYVLSGFFITGILLRDIEKYGRIRFAEFYSRRARRLMPAATVVLLVTALAVWTIMPVARLQDTGIDILSAANYLANFRFAGQATNYFATQDPSPVLHFWSLAVEEQFYLVWPIFILGCARLSKRLRRNIITPGIVLVTACSLLACIWYTFQNQPVAFYMFPLRAWELGVGALAHILSSKALFNRSKFASTFSWTGLTIIVACGIFFTERLAFPGYAAIAPALGCFLLAATAPHAKGPSVLLTFRPLVKLGHWSYSIYLWHWPVLVLATLWLGRKLTLSQASLRVGASILLAWATFKYVENPMRNSHVLKISNVSTFIVALIFLLTSIGPALSIAQRGNFLENSTIAYTFTKIEAPTELVQKIGMGAEMSKLPKSLTPSLAQVEQDFPSSRDCFLLFADATLPQDCPFGNPDGKHSIMLTGDSHAHQWLDAVQEIALKHDWKLYFLAKVACPFTTAPPTWSGAKASGYPQCTEYRKRILKRISLLKPDVLVVGQARGIVSYDIPGFAEMIGKIHGQKDMILLGDNPYPAGGAELRSTCLSRHQDNITRCNLKAREAVSATYNNQLLTVAKQNGAEMIPVEQWFCSKETCPAVINNIQVYRTGQHITSTYATVLTPCLETELLQALKAMNSSLK